MAMFEKVTKSRNREIILIKIRGSNGWPNLYFPTIYPQDLIILSLVLNIHSIFLTNNEKQKK